MVGVIHNRPHISAGRVAEEQLDVELLADGEEHEQGGGNDPQPGAPSEPQVEPPPGGPTVNRSGDQRGNCGDNEERSRIELPGADEISSSRPHHPTGHPAGRTHHPQIVERTVDIDGRETDQGQDDHEWDPDEGKAGSGGMPVVALPEKGDKGPPTIDWGWKCHLRLAIVDQMTLLSGVECWLRVRQGAADLEPGADDPLLDDAVPSSR